MSAAKQRDDAISLAKLQPKAALERARRVTDPWFRAQALSWVARFTDGNPVAIAAEAAKAASNGKDTYQKCAVRAWDIAALAERNHIPEARKNIVELLPILKNVEPPCSRCEAYLLVMQAAFKISDKDVKNIYDAMRSYGEPEEHWRCRRALRNGAKMIAGELQPRPFFW